MKRTVIFILLSCCILDQNVIGYTRVICNYGTKPIITRMDYAGGPVCPTSENTIAAASCAQFETGGCCLRGIDLKDPDGKFPEKWVGLDDYDGQSGLQVMEQTGAGMACANTKLTFWNNLKTGKFQTPGTAARREDS